MPASPSDLFVHLDRLGIAHSTLEHAPTFTVAESRDIKNAMPGGHTKNLFLKDKAGEIVLISAWAESVLKLNQVHRLLGTKRLSFGPPDLMEELLGVVPGSVTAFALINDIDVRVRFVLDQALMAFETINFHPLHNGATTAISSASLETFVTSTGHTLEIVDFKQLL